MKITSKLISAAYKLRPDIKIAICDILIASRVFYTGIYRFRRLYCLSAPVYLYILKYLVNYTDNKIAVKLSIQNLTVLFYSVHPNIYKFIDVLKNVQKDNYIKMCSSSQIKKIRRDLCEN